MSGLPELRGKVAVVTGGASAELAAAGSKVGASVGACGASWLAVAPGRAAMA